MKYTSNTLPLTSIIISAVVSLAISQNSCRESMPKNANNGNITSSVTKPINSDRKSPSNKNNNSSGVTYSVNTSNNNSSPGVTYSIAPETPTSASNDANSPRPRLTREDLKLAEQAIKESLNQPRLYPEDIFTLALLKYHQTTNHLPSLSGMEIGIQRVLLAYNISGWKISATRDFWEQYVSANWAAVDAVTATLKGKFNWYILVKTKHRYGAVAHWMSGLAQAEEAWGKVIRDWKEQESRRSTLEEMRRREYEAWQTIQEADWAIKEAAKALG